MADVAFCRLLAEAIADEEKAVRDYAELKDAGAGAVNALGTIEGIAKDEARHAEELKAIGKMLCEAKPEEETAEETEALAEESED